MKKTRLIVIACSKIHEACQAREKALRCGYVDHAGATWCSCVRILPDGASRHWHRSEVLKLSVRWRHSVSLEVAHGAWSVSQCCPAHRPYGIWVREEDAVSPVFKLGLFHPKRQRKTKCGNAAGHSVLAYVLCGHTDSAPYEPDREENVAPP